MRNPASGGDAVRHALLSDRVCLPAALQSSRVVGAVAAANGTLVAANDAFLELAGRTREELERGDVHWPVLCEPRQPHEPFETTLLRPDGSSVTMRTEILSRDGDAIVALMVDVSAARVADQALTRAREVLEERNRQLFGGSEKLTEHDETLQSAGKERETAAHLEAERQRVEELAARLAEANRELDAFSYSVSHDLRAPLRSIDGFSRVLLSKHAPLLDERGRDYLQRVRTATQRMSHLLDDLLRLARTSRATFSAATVDLSAGAQQIAAELQQSDPARRVTWKIEPRLMARGDRTLLRVLLDNLLGNAWKFTSRREHAVIEVGRDETGFFVRDNGAGFDMRYADQLFGLFQRLHSADEFEGTGIGLATVQRIVHRHGGRVWAEGAVDRGATIHFTLGESK